MAFTFCTNCGEKIDDSEKVCPHCGHVKGADRSYRYGQEWYGNTDNSNENKNNNDGSDGNNGSQQQNPYGQYQPPFGQQTPWRQPNQQPQRQMSIALVIFSVINIIFGCCCIGMVFGIVGLIFTLNARNAPTDAEEARRKKIALALNIVGLALTIIYAVVYVITVLVKYLPL